VISLVDISSSANRSSGFVLPDKLMDIIPTIAITNIKNRAKPPITIGLCFKKFIPFKDFGAIWSK
jgi:hypothetical protein